MIRNPVIGKELVGVLRSRAAAALAVGFVAALCLLAWAMWPAAGVNPLGGAQSRLFFSVLLATQLAMLALFSPPFAATAISAEREAGTWEMLYYSRLRPDEILLGKLAGASAFLLVLVALSLPVGGACLLLGGVSVRELFLAYLVLAAAGVSFGLVGLTWSALLRSSFAALIATYLTLLMLCGGVFLPLLLAPELASGQATLHAVRCVSPFAALLAITRDAWSMMPGGSGGAVARFFTWNGALAGVMVLLVSARILIRPGPRRTKHRKVVDESTPLAMRIVRRMFFLIDPRRRKRSIGLWINPILVLDLRTRSAGVAHLLRAGFVCLIFAIGLVILVSGTWGATQPDTIRLIALSFQIGLIGLVGPSLTIGSISSEVEGRTFDMLRMTPLSAWTFFSGKFTAAAIPSLMLVVAAMPVFLALQAIQQVTEMNMLTALLSNRAALLALLAICGVTIAFTLSTGLFFSCLCRTTARAGAWAYAVVAFAMVGTLLALVLRDRIGHGALRFVLAFNPIITAVGAVSEERFIGLGRWQDCVLALGSVSVLFILGSVYRLWRAAGPDE